MKKFNKIGLISSLIIIFYYLLSSGLDLLLDDISGLKYYVILSFSMFFLYYSLFKTLNAYEKFKKDVFLQIIIGLQLIIVLYNIIELFGFFNVWLKIGLLNIKSIILIIFSIKVLRTSKNQVPLINPLKVFFITKFGVMILVFLINILLSKMFKDNFVILSTLLYMLNAIPYVFCVIFFFKNNKNEIKNINYISEDEQT